MTTTPIPEKNPTFVIEKDTGEEIPLPPTDLPYDDGEPLETHRHRLAMNTLINSVEQALIDRQDFFAGGNMFIYYSSAQARNQDFRGPDFFVVLDVDGNSDRKSWIVWEEGGRYPDVIVELMSASTAKIDVGPKKEIYRRVFKTSDYFVFDPYNPNSFQGWHLNGNLEYQPLVTNEKGWLWCQSLGLWLGTWQGIINRHEAIWLRFYTSEGELIPLLEEAAVQKAIEAEQKAIEAEQKVTEAEQKANEAEQKAEELAAMLAKYQEQFGELS
jgi:Uma2 family endonuclease